MKSLLGSAGVALAITVACGNGGAPTPGGSAGRSSGDAGESGEAGAVSGGTGGTAGRGGANGKGGSGGKAGASASGGRPATGGSAGTSSTAEAGAGGALGEPGSLLPSHGKGTRLDVKELRAADMPPVFVTFYDTELDVDCRFVRASDDRLRCLPPYTPRFPLRATQMFLDDTCTEPVAIGDDTCVAAEDSYVTETVVTQDSCAERKERVFRATVLADDMPIFSNDGGGCTEQGSTSNGPYIYFSMVEADPDDFVEGSTEIVETPTRLSVQRLVAADGAFLTLGLADPNVNRECRVFGPEDASFCVPAPAFSGRDYRASDDECRVPISLATCSVPLTIIDLVDRDDYTFFEAGPEYTGTVYGGINVCDVVSDEAPLYEIGDPIPESEFPNVTFAYQGGGRLRHRVFSDAAGTELAVGAVSGSAIASAGGLYDTDFDTTCSIRRYTDLAEYCVPDDITSESPFNLYYADPGCTEQLAVCGTTGCPRDIALLFGVGEGAVCGTIPDFTKVLVLGDPVDLDEVYVWNSGLDPGSQCTGPVSTDGYGTIREITGETGPGAFVKMLPAGG